MSVLAVVSKAVFEKEARVGGKLVGPGDVWPTALYASQNPGLASLASGGALFLATVRPGDQLWLVGVLEAPKKSSQGWGAAANRAAVRDISALLPKLRFATGKGITAEPGKLGMSLQTPRQLTAEDEALLRGSFAPSSSAPSASTPSASTSSSSSSAAPPTLEWKLDHYRRRALTTKLTAKEAELLDAMMGLLEANDEDEGGIELADVIDTRSGKVVALLALWPMEAGFLVDTATGEALADIYELTFDAHGDAALRARMKAAFEASTIRFDDPPRVFDGKRDTPKESAAPVAAPAGDDPALLAEIAALHAELDRTKDDTKDEERDVGALMTRIGGLQTRVFGDALRPYPMLRPFELTAAQRAWLELIYAHYQSQYDGWSQGLPFKWAQHVEHAPGFAGSPLARLLGKKPPLALDTTVPLDGHPHPLWAIFNDAVVGLRPESAFLDAILGQPLAVREGAWRQLAGGDDRLGGIHPRNKKEAQRGWAEPKDVDAAVERYGRMVRAVFDSLGDRGGEAALEVLAAPVPESAYERTNVDALRTAALEGLARRAKAAGGELDPKYDAILPQLIRDDGRSLLRLFSLLPPERAGELTGLAGALIEAFPSESGMRRVVEQMGKDVEWQFAKGYWAKLATKLAAKFPEAALPLLRATKPKLTRHPDGLDKAIEAAEKALAKSAAKSTTKAKKKK